MVSQCYIVLDPNMRTNPTERHVVVHVDEWVAITLGEKKDYSFLSEHDTYASAGVKREELNRKPEGITLCLDDSEEAEIAC